MTQPAPPQLRLPFQWEQGEHMAITGGTGSGKTTLANVLLTRRRFTISLRSKRDKTPLPGKTLKTAEQLRRLDWRTYPRVVLDPEYAHQAREFVGAFEYAWKMGGWTLYADEAFYLTDHLKMGRQLTRMLTQGRSNNITMICGMQRPAWVPRYCLSEPLHLIAFRTEPRDLKTLKDIGSAQWANAVEQLERYQFAWYYRLENQTYVGRLQDLTGGG